MKSSPQRHIVFSKIFFSTRNIVSFPCIHLQELFKFSSFFKLSTFFPDPSALFQILNVGHYAMPKVIKVKLKTGGPVMISCCLDQSFLLFDAPFSQGGIEYFWKLIPRGIIAWCKTQGENLVCLFIWLYGKVLFFTKIGLMQTDRLTQKPLVIYSL